MELIRTPTTKEFEILDWGVIDYQFALDRQLAELNRIHDQQQQQYDPKTLGSIIFCSHPPVVTKGRATVDSDITTWSGSIVEVSRGGKATYHGPSQQVIYPIVPLKKVFQSDLHKYLRFLESTIVGTLSVLDIHAEARTSAEQNLTGVWVGDKKIASIGIAVKNWISYHGIAINVDADPEAFKGINPCGMNASVMTSIEEVRGQKTDRALIKKLFYNTWLDLLPL